MKIQPEVKRQLLHIGVVGFAFLLRFLHAPWMLLITVMAFVHNVFLLPKYAPDLFRNREYLMQGITVNPVIVALLILLFADNLILAGGAWAVLSCGDGFSSLIGSRYPLIKIPWNPEKSLGGLLAFWVFATIGAVLVMAFIGPFPTWGHLLFVALAAALLAGIFETLPLPWDDNIIVALSAAAALSVVWGVDVSPALPQISLMSVIIAFIVNLLLAPVAWWFGWVSKSGALSVGILGLLIWGLGGVHWYSLLVLFFIVGSAATRLGYHEKDYLGVAQKGKRKRDVKYALANCLFALLAVLGFGFSDGVDIYFQLFFAAAFATVLADTVSTELGQLYGKTPFMLTTFRPAKPGTVGAISAEGTLFGMGASLVFGVFAFAVGVVPLHGIPAVTLGAWAGSMIESYIGSRWTDEGIEINNEWMNLLNTVMGGSIAVILYSLTVGL